MDAVEEIKARVDIEQVVGEHVDLKRSGASLKGLCPFHTEKTPSFYVFPATGTFRCFGCGQGGDVFTFVQNYGKLDFREALKQLAERAGIELPDDRDRQKQVEENARTYQANEAALEFWRDQLKGATGKPAQAYLYKRKLSVALQVSFGLGYAADSRQALQDSLTGRGFSNAEMIAAGLLFVPDDGGKPRDRFHGRLMFPIRDSRGRVTGFGGRLLGDGEPKYLNSPQGEVFDKSRSLFAIEHAADAIRESRRSVVVEGYIDAIRAHEAGFKNVVASLGTAITVQQLQILSKLAPAVILALDPDAAGQTAAVRAGLTALAGLPRRQRQLPDSMGRRMVDTGLSVDLRIARIPEGAGDPDELIQRDPSQWENLIDQSVPAFEFFFNTVVQTIDRENDGWRQDVIERVMPVIQEFPFALGTQVDWIERLADLTGVQARLLQNRLTVSGQAGRSTRRRSNPSVQPAAISVPIRPTDPGTEAEDSLLRVLLRHPISPEVVPALQEMKWKRAEMEELLQAVVSSAGSGRMPDISGVAANAGQLADRVLGDPSDDLRDDQVLPAIRLHIAIIRLTGAKKSLLGLQASLSQMGPEDMDTGLKALNGLLEEKNVLEHQIETLQKQVIAGA